MLRFYEDPETGQPHIYRLAVTEREVEEVLAHSLEDREGSGGAHIALGQTASGRYLRVVYVVEPESVFVVTAYDLGPKAKKALQRRRRKKRK